MEIMVGKTKEKINNKELDFHTLGSLQANYEESRRRQFPSMSSPMKQMLTKLSEEELQRKTINRKIGRRFIVWSSYWIRSIRSIIRAPHIQEPNLMLEIDFVLHQFKHHFVPSASPRKIWSAFRYLRHYFRLYPSVSLKHCKKAEAMLQRIEEALSSDVEKAGADVRAWTGNRMWAVLRAIEKPKFKDANIMTEIKFYIKAMETFFIETRESRRFRNAFCYLRHYFQVYPWVRQRQSKKAVKMIGRIYEGMEYEFTYQAEIKPSTVEIEGKMPRRITEISVLEISEAMPVRVAA